MAQEEGLTDPTAYPPDVSRNETHQSTNWEPIGATDGTEHS